MLLTPDCNAESEHYLTALSSVSVISLTQVHTLCPMPLTNLNSLLANDSGQSGADNFMAYCVYDMRVI